jgi:hypothetical protein
MLMNLVGPRFTSPPTTQVKANNSQRSGNGLSEAEKAIVREMKLLKASTESIGQSILNSLAKGGNPSELRIQLATQLDKLNALIRKHPVLADKTFPQKTFEGSDVSPEQMQQIRKAIIAEFSSNPTE